MRKRSPNVAYIPVDISEGLLHHAVLELKHIAMTPVGLLSDFEQRLDWICGQTERFMGRPWLIALLGNTIGNLDKFEHDFLVNLQRNTKSGDLVVIEAGIHPSNSWDESQLTEAVRKSSAGSKRFYALGLARQTGAQVEDVLQEIDSRIAIRPGKSDVPNATSVEVFYLKTKKTIINIRCYDWEKLQEWLKGFEFEIPPDLTSKVLFESQPMGCGLVIVRRK